MEFNLISFFIGLAAIIIGTLMVIFFEPISRNCFSGISSFDRVKLAGVISIVLGFVVLLNIHSIFLNLFVHIVFKR